MNKRLALVVVAGLILGSCSNLGLGEVDCTPPERDLSASTILTVQAVPTARYTPCLNELRLGWDGIDWFAENGRAGFEIIKGVVPFLTATVTPSCDTSDAVLVPSGRTDISRFESINSQTAEIRITIVPTGTRPLARANALALRFRSLRLDDRPATMTIDEDFEAAAAVRVERALNRGDFVWIIDELDVDEKTVELRSAVTAASGAGLSPEDALDEIEDHAPDVFYRGHWYFTFEGGCITYEFDATGSVAETVAADAADAIDFYPAYRVRQIAERAGYTIVEDE